MKRKIKISLSWNKLKSISKYIYLHLNDFVSKTSH